MAENLVKRGMIWYYREQRGKKGILRTLRTRDRREAKRLAAEMKERLDKGELSVRVKQEFPTVGDCYDIYIKRAQAGLTRASQETARSNFLSLCSVVRHAIDKKPHLVTEEEVKALKLNEIKPGTTEEPGAAEKFQKYELARGRAARSINSTWRQAISLFTVEMMGQYSLEKYRIPDEFVAFLRSSRLKTNPIQKFDPMEKDEVKRLLEATTDLAISGKPFAGEMAKVVSMAYYLGMRAKEILLARKRDFQDTPKGLRLYIDTVKGGSPRTITVSARLRDLLYDKAAKPEAFIIADGMRDNKTARYDIVYRHTNAFLREFLETEQDKEYKKKHGRPSPRKLLHHLRKQAGAVLVTNYGLYHAQEFLGHKNPQVTNMFYSALLQDLKSIDAVEVLG
jgi:integrase